MKDRIIKILLIVFIVLHAASPLVEFAANGYDDIPAILSDVYDNGIVVVLSAALLRLYNLKDKDE